MDTFIDSIDPIDYPVPNTSLKKRRKPDSEMSYNPPSEYGIKKDIKKLLIKQINLWSSLNKIKKTLESKTETEGYHMIHFKTVYSPDSGLEEIDEKYNSEFTPFDKQRNISFVLIKLANFGEIFIFVTSDKRRIYLKK